MSLRCDPLSIAFAGILLLSTIFLAKDNIKIGLELKREKVTREVLELQYKDCSRRMVRMELYCDEAITE